MDIHKPKAAHSWREFLIEIGTIVTGILIALALEQAIEGLHERKIAAEARQAVRAEVQENLWWLNVRARHDACTQSRLQEIGQLLDRASHGRPYAAAQWIGVVPYAKLTTLRWDANAQAGRTSLFTPEEQRDYDNFYFTFVGVRQAQADEAILWSKLQALDGQDHLTPEAIYGFSILYSQERYESGLIRLLTHRGFQDAAIMHLKPVNSDPVEIEGLHGALRCPSITSPQDPAAAQGGWYGTELGDKH